jgi:uncharacterized membrane protein YgdD (TMEM256/DUF423 family)
MAGRAGVFVGLAGLNGAFGVVAGALAAHGEQMGHNEWLPSLIELGSRYQLIHAAVLLGVAALLSTRASLAVTLAGILFLSGCLLFSGGLYLNGFLHWSMGTKMAPLGGMSFILGWLMLALGGWRRG